MNMREKRQKVMEMAVMGIVHQGGPSIGTRYLGWGTAVAKSCRYNSPGGVHCHLGFFTDGEVLEGATAYDVADSYPVGDVGGDFLHDLQRAHDSAATIFRSRDTGEFWVAYSKQLLKLCVDWGLEYPGELL